MGDIADMDYDNAFEQELSEISSPFEFDEFAKKHGLPIIGETAEDAITRINRESKKKDRDEDNVPF